MISKAVWSSNPTKGDQRAATHGAWILAGQAELDIEGLCVEEMITGRAIETPAIRHKG